MNFVYVFSCIGPYCICTVCLSVLFYFTVLVLPSCWINVNIIIIIIIIISICICISISISISVICTHFILRLSWVQNEWHIVVVFYAIYTSQRAQLSATEYTTTSVVYRMQDEHWLNVTVITRATRCHVYLNTTTTATVNVTSHWNDYRRASIGSIFTARRIQ